jgi:hypothetical protein
MIIATHQPDYIPYWGYFYKIMKSDVFVILDDVQYSRNNMHNWNRIKTNQGESRLKIPVESQFGVSKINEVKTKDELGWRENHLKSIEMNYKKSPYFNDFYPKFEDLIMTNYSSLSDMNITINTYICEEFGFNTKFVKSSDLNIKSNKENRIIDICTALNGDTYLSGNGAKVYQEESNFKEKGLILAYTDFYPFEYKQLWNDFIPNMSIIDYIFNCGFSIPHKQLVGV